MTSMATEGQAGKQQKLKNKNKMKNNCFDT